MTFRLPPKSALFHYLTYMYWQLRHYSALISIVGIIIITAAFQQLSTDLLSVPVYNSQDVKVKLWGNYDDPFDHEIIVVETETKIASRPNRPTAYQFGLNAIF